MITDARLSRMTSGIIDAIESARKEQGLSVRELSARSGVSMNYVYRILRGEHTPSVEILIKVLATLGLTLAVHSDEQQKV